MRIFILALGTRGDFEPFWNLGRALRRRGHQVTIGSSGFHVADAADPELDWVVIGDGDKAQLVALLRMLAGLASHSARASAFVERWLAPQLAAGKQATIAAAARHDYFISNVKLPLRRAGQAYPGALVTYDPPTALGDVMADPVPPEPRTLELVAMNRALADPDFRWGAQYHFTGFWQRAPWSRPHPPALARYLDGGAPPVVMTMGSMATFDADALARCFAEALALCGLRGVLVGGWAAPRLAPCAHVTLFDEADYEWLFARAACVIHHGGVGTLAAVVRAGVPSILLPQVASQDSWGRLLTRAQLCAGVLDSATLAPAALAKAMREAVADGPVRATAARWPARLALDPGVEGAADLIEAHWNCL